jgi:hypothetical protein
VNTLAEGLGHLQSNHESETDNANGDWLRWLGIGLFTIAKAASVAFFTSRMPAAYYSLVDTPFVKDVVLAS